jgi:hypothetical protein
MLNAPILFLIFNRPQQTKQVFEIIKEVRPNYLFVAADGPRDNVENDEIKCKEARKVILEGVDWECEVKTLFRDQNLGCKASISSALNWFFSHVEEGIILEDDCLPSLSFFYYCETLLEEYRNDTKIISINGCNYGYEYVEASYYYSRYMNVWGWATWRRVAESVSYEIPEWLEMSKKDQIQFLSSRLKLSSIDLDTPWFDYWKTTIDSIADDTLNTWDFFWMYHQFKNKLFAVLPAVNLIENTGFHKDATHTTYQQHPAAFLQRNEISFPLKPNKDLSPNIEYEVAVLQPVCYMYSRKPNSYYFKKWLLKNPLISSMFNLKNRVL